MKKEILKPFLPIIQALAKEKIIQKKNKNGEWYDTDNIDFTLSIEDYRIKPDKKYIPFDCSTDLLGRKIKTAIGIKTMLILEQNSRGITTYFSTISYQDLLKYTFLDTGEICGVYQE